jgi:outer membrane PBP1 activator LpoA protein
MNRELRKAIYNKQMLRNKNEKYHTDKTWEAYRKNATLLQNSEKDQSEHLF